MDDAELECLLDPVPDRLPVLDRGRHAPGDGKVCAMEAAAWLAGEPWTDHPRSVHPVIAMVARAVNDSVSDAQRAKLWPLVIASVGTARPRDPLLTYRLRRSSRRILKQTGGDMRATWVGLLAEHARLTGHRPAPLRLERVRELERHLRS